MDFVSDALFNGKRFLLITVEGVFTRKWLAIHINQVLKGEVVSTVMARLTIQSRRSHEKIR